jgi:AcrR family transcriptional regulator
VPKVVDHSERRREIAEAVWRVLMRDGLRGASVRAVVAESGLSSGAIRHYFSSHDDLLRFAGHVVVERGPDRIASVLRNRRVVPRRRAALLLEELVPLDHRRQTETLVFAALADLDRARPADRRFRLDAYDGCRAIARMAVLLLAGAEVTNEPITPLPGRWERIAERLHLVTDGLAGQYLFYPGLHEPNELSRILRRAVDDAADELAGRNESDGVR